MKRLLMVAYHFPPLAGSSGIQRTLRFVQHLPKFGWEPIVLTAHPRAYEKVSDDLMRDVPEGTIVERAFALDTARHLSFGGRYIGAMARPDRWVSWKFGAVRTGMEMIKRYRPDAIWTTYPIATAHLVGAELQRRSGLPWIADFRDPMAQEGYPTDPQVWKSFKAIEQHAVEHAQLSVFTTPSAAETYRKRYPQFAERITALENGYDEETFATAEAAGISPEPLTPGCLTLLHSGIVYPSERDPRALFAALEQLKKQGAGAEKLRVRFRASVHDELLQALSKQHGVESMVEICPAIPYRDALQEMLRADALLIMQAANCNEQIPAKAYEYLRAGRPIIGLTDAAGDTANVLRNAGVDSIAPLDNPESIASLLIHWLSHAAGLPLPAPAAVKEASREGRTAKLVDLLRDMT